MGEFWFASPWLPLSWFFDIFGVRELRALQWENKQTTRWLVKEVGKCFEFRCARWVSRAAIAVLNLEGSFHLLLLLLFYQRLCHGVLLYKYLSTLNDDEALGTSEDWTPHLIICSEVFCPIDILFCLTYLHFIDTFCFGTNILENGNLEYQLTLFLHFSQPFCSLSCFICCSLYEFR